MLEPGVGTIPGHRWGADRAWAPSLLPGLLALTLSLARDSGLHAELSRDSAATRSATALSLRGFGPRPGRWVVPRAAPSVSPARGGGGRWGRGARTSGRRGRQAALGRARPRASQQVRSPASAHVRREEPAGGGGRRCPSRSLRVSGRGPMLSVISVWAWVSLALDTRLEPAGPRSGVGSRKHVEPLGVQVRGGGSLPWGTRSAPGSPLPAVRQVWGSVSILAGRHRALRMVTPLPRASAGPQGSQPVCALRGGYRRPGLL